MTQRSPWVVGLLVTSRVLFTVAALILLYYLVPFDEPLDASLLAVLCFSGLVLVGLIVFQVRMIMRSSVPALRAIEGLATVIPLLVLGFASIYYLMADADPSNFTEPLTRTDAMYFSLTVFSTVGFGDISASSQVSRVLVSLQIAVNLVVVGLGLRIITGAVQRVRNDSPTAPGAP